MATKSKVPSTAGKTKRTPAKKAAQPATAGKPATARKTAAKKTVKPGSAKAGKPQTAQKKTAGAKVSPPGQAKEKKAAAKKAPLRPGSAGKKTAGKKSGAKKTANKINLLVLRPPFEAYGGEKAYLFCSYAHEDMKDVFAVISKINKMGYRIWYDEGIMPGLEWPEAIGDALIKCSQYLIFLTPNAVASRNVRNEINLAYSENKDLLVVFLKETKLSGGMKLQLGTVHCIKKHTMTEASFYKRLDKYLKSKIKN